MGLFSVGDAVPWFTAASVENPKYHFDTLAGQPIVLYFFHAPETAEALAVLEDFHRQQARLAQGGTLFVAVGLCAVDAAISDRFPNSSNYLLLWDPDGRVRRQCGYEAKQTQQAWATLPLWVLDQRLRVNQIFSVSPETVDQAVEGAIAAVNILPAIPSGAAVRQAPVLFIPGVFEPDFCQQLITLLNTHGSTETGVLEEQQDGKSFNVAATSLKRRRDLALEKAGMEWIHQLTERVIRRIKPEIEKAFQYSIGSFERPVVACYDAVNQGFFGRHRDNMTVEGAKRRFAMTINLNTGDYEGGCLQFPEYGDQLFSPAIGEAVIFSCSLMHQVTPVTQGKRYAFLLFFNEPERKPQSQIASPSPAGSKKRKRKSGVGFK
ncbi:MAG: 2OG-Fe(II) oxygenase [Cyanobacteria bacterium J06636_16]